MTYLSLPRSHMTYLSLPRSHMTYPSLPRSHMTYPSLPRPHMTYPSLPRSHMTYPSLPRSQMTYLSLPRSHMSYPSLPHSHVNYPFLALNLTTAKPHPLWEQKASSSPLAVSCSLWWTCSHVTEFVSSGTCQAEKLRIMKTFRKKGGCNITRAASLLIRER